MSRSTELTSVRRLRHLLATQQGQEQSDSEKDGRFRIAGIVADVKFTLSIYQGRKSLVGKPRIGARQTKSDETLDLGAIRLKPAQSEPLIKSNHEHPRTPRKIDWLNRRRPGTIRG